MGNVEVSKNGVTSDKAIASLVLGILSILIPFIGLVLGIIGIIFSRKATKELVKTNERGQGLATSGLLCSIVGIVFQLFAVIGLLAFTTVTTETAVQFLFT
ncbi:DUF4190 domain-containing protein [Lentibacillus cibarius]|uniref:DUF4190 domain-containing protein n=1 Tax=Lentibacillus cibarius TaxID=2583219 RepID=A0A549Y930_9BACI|nr:DUF4190 domain-containing protein [Lentibacillus cibarius]TRM08319.1 DUF4190 domain-containing protein [Lentibacillus cibarius]TRM08328.1 DUF4190 domain-containing protein [Lentibacillus cibarius]TRM10782.1 DUF4190 domain-containing protein [Lentibacillus cibarius]